MDLAQLQLQLPQLEAMCERLYNSQDPRERAQAEAALKPFQSAEYVPHCKAVLGASGSPYAQLMAASALLRSATDAGAPLPPAARLDVRAFLLAFLDERGPGLEPYVVAQVVTLAARTAKLGWFEDDAHRGAASDAAAFLDRGLALGSAPHYLLGLRLLGALVAEFGAPTPGRTLTAHRKAAVSFRDAGLLAALDAALRALRDLRGGGAAALAARAGGAAAPALEARLGEAALALALGCLSYDFVGTCADDAGDDVGTLQVPAAWRPAVEDPATPALFLEWYAATAPPASAAAMECLARLASVRRSLFSSEAERAAFLGRLVAAARDLLRSQRGLAHHDNYHEFCRLLGRLKTNYQLSELVGAEAYPEWARLAADFTVSSLASWRWAAGGVAFLLGLWSRLVSSVPYLKGGAPAGLDEHVPRVLRAAVGARLEGAAAHAGGGGPPGGEGDPLCGDDDELAAATDALPYLARFRYAEAAEYIGGLMDPLLAAYASAALAGAGAGDAAAGLGAGPGAGAADGGAAAAVAAARALLPAGAPPPPPPAGRALDAVEAQLAWLVHVVAAVVRGRVNAASADAHEALDGDLAGRVFALAAAARAPGVAGRGGAPYRARLDAAVLAFLQAFRKAYVGEAAAHAPRAYARLAERAGVGDHGAAVAAAAAAAVAALRARGAPAPVVGAALALLADLAAGYTSGRLLGRLDVAAYLLARHSPAEFPFLADPAHARHRTAFYATLARLLWADEARATPARLREFLAPLAAPADALAAAAAGGPGALRAAAPPAAVAGLFRDLRGVAAAAGTRRAYGQLFDWAHPARLPLAAAALGAWAGDPAVTTPVLKFLAEFVLNKGQRLAFDASSPNGILLFREVSRCLVAYAGAVAPPGAPPPPPPAGDPYGGRYKAVSLCLVVLTRALSGGYVNFGVFELYGDPALRDALAAAARLARGVPLPDLLAYRKVGRAWYAAAEALAAGHAGALAALDGGAAAAWTAASLEAGLRALDPATSSQCAAALDSLASAALRHGPGGEEPTPAGAALAAALRAPPAALPRCLEGLFEAVLLDECPNQWSLSRPMLPLALLLEGEWGALRARLAAAAPPERRPALAACLDRLTAELAGARALDAKSRDRFTQALTVARHDFRAAARVV